MRASVSESKFLFAQPRISSGGSCREPVFVVTSNFAKLEIEANYDVVLVKELYMQSPKRNPFLDIIKAFCILFVIITHDQISDAFRLRAFFPFCINMAVPMFMIISGYVYAASFDRNSISKIEDAYTLKFLLPKFIRYTVPFLMMFVVEIVGEILIAYV